MKNKKFVSLTGWVILLAFIGMVMNLSWEFVGNTCIGLALMLIISHVDYRKISGNFTLTWILAFLGLLCLILYGLPRMWGSIVISAALVAVCFCIKEEEVNKVNILRWTFAGALFAIHIWLVVIACIYYRQLIPVFFSREGKEAYIYQVVEGILQHSRWLGRGVEEGELFSYLPRYTQSSILVTYISSYGWCVGFLVIILLTCFLAKIIHDMGKMNNLGRMITTGCIVILGMEFVVTVLENLLCIPYTVYGVFLPFFSQGRKEILLTYVLLGMIMSAYRFETWGKSENEFVL